MIMILMAINLLLIMMLGMDDDDIDEDDMPDHLDGIFNADLLDYDNWDEEVRRE